MATIKVLGQSNPAATTLTDLYTVPASTQTVISSITICNQAGTNSTFRVAIAPNGEANATKHYLYFDLPLSKNNTFVATIGITLDAADVVRVFAGNASMSFNLFGEEIT